MEGNSTGDTFFTCVQYKHNSDTIYASDPTLVKPKYYNLGKLLDRDITPARRWKESSNYNVELSEEIKINEDDSLFCENQHREDDDGLSYCFCRKLASHDITIECSGMCRIRWFHLSCVALSEKTVPKGDWFCPRCLGGNHWCICGRPQGEGRKALIGCS